MILDCRYDRITGEKFYEFCVGVGDQVLEATHLMLKFKYLCFLEYQYHRYPNLS